MTKNKKIGIMIILWVSIIFDCKAQVGYQQIVGSRCIILNDSGYSDLSRYKINRQRKNYLNSAISLFKLAIECDSSYLIAHKNLADAYVIEGRFKEAISIVKKLITLSGGSSSLMIWQGSLYRDNNQIDSANTTFAKVDSIYDQRFKRYPGNVGILRDKILLIEISKGTDEAKKMLHTFITLYPRDSTALINQTRNIFYLRK